MLHFRSEVRPADRPVVRSLVAGSGYFSAAEGEIAVELVDERLQRGAASGYEFVFAEELGRVVGYACHGPIAGTDGRFDLYWIVVDDAERGRGLGRRILARVEQEVRAQGGRRIYVDTSSREQYASTRAFYRACGYAIAAELVDFYRRGDGKTIFVKVLADDPPADQTVP